MKTDPSNEATTRGFLQTVILAVNSLKQQLQRDYEQAYPGLHEIVHLVLDEEESRAWKLSAFPHLLLPDLVEAHIQKLDLEPVATTPDDLFASHRFAGIDNFQPISSFALSRLSLSGGAKSEESAPARVLAHGNTES